MKHMRANQFAVQEANCVRAVHESPVRVNKQARSGHTLSTQHKLGHAANQF